MKLLQNMNWIYWAGWSWFRGVAKASFNYEVIGKERLIEEGSALVVSNHVSFLDPPLVGIAHDNGVWFLARKTLFKGFLCLALSKAGTRFRLIRRILT